MQRVSGVVAGLVAGLAVSIIAGATLTLAPSTAAAELLEWDQKAVTEEAARLATEVRTLFNYERNQPNDQVGSRQNARMRYRQTLQVLEKSCLQLKTRLEGGADRKATLNIAKKIRSLVRDAREEGRRLFINESDLQRIRPVEDSLALIGPYYFEDTPVDKAVEESTGE